MAPFGSSHKAPATAKAARLARASCTHQPASSSISHKSNRAFCAFNPTPQGSQPITHTAGKRLTDPRRHVSCQCTALGTSVEPGWKDEDFIEVGTLGRPHGTQGEVVVSIDTSFPEERFANPGVRYIQPPPARGMFVSRPNEAPREVELVSGRPHVTKGNTVWLLRFKEITDRDDAETLRNYNFQLCKRRVLYRMLIHKSQRATIDGEDEFYSNDLVGLTVLLYPYHAAAQPAADNSSATETSDSETQSELEPASESRAPPAVDVVSTEGNGSAASASAVVDELPVSTDGASMAVQPENEEEGDARMPVSSVSSIEAETASPAEALNHDSGEEELEEGDEEPEIVFWDLGKVTDVYDGTGTHGVVRVDFSSGLLVDPDGTLRRVASAVKGTKQSGLLPFARDIVPEIDLEEGVMIVDPPVGWLEMYLTPSNEKKKSRFKKRKSPKTPAVAVVEPEAAAKAIDDMLGKR